MALSAQKPARQRYLQSDIQTKTPDVSQLGSSFLSFACACCSKDEDVTTILGECLRNIIKDAGGHQNALDGATALLIPSKRVAEKTLEIAISEVFGLPHTNLREDALAAMAVDGRHRHTGIHHSSPVTVQDVADALTIAGDTPDDFDEAVKCLTRLLAKTQKGIEPFFLVCALRGQLAPSSDIVHAAVAKAKAPGTTM